MGAERHTWCRSSQAASMLHAFWSRFFAERGDSPDLARLLMRAENHALRAAKEMRAVAGALHIADPLLLQRRTARSLARAEEIAHETDRLGTLVETGSRSQTEAIDLIRPLLYGLARQLESTSHAMSNSKNPISVPSACHYLRDSGRFAAITASLVHQLHGWARLRSQLVARERNLISR